MTLAVFDIDGVLADVRHRLHFIERTPKDWDGFFAAAPMDSVLAEGQRLVAEHHDAGHRIAYLTGRPERCRTDTVDWLGRHGFPHGLVHMRGDSDRRPARLTKADAARRLSAADEVVIVVDDDAAVVDVLRAAGLPVLHATWMDGGTDGVDGPLAQAQERDGRS